MHIHVYTPNPSHPLLTIHTHTHKHTHTHTHTHTCVCICMNMHMCVCVCVCVCVPLTAKHASSEQQRACVTSPGTFAGPCHSGHLHFYSKEPAVMRIRVRPTHPSSVRRPNILEPLKGLNILVLEGLHILVALKGPHILER